MDFFQEFELVDLSEIFFQKENSVCGETKGFFIEFVMNFELQAES